MALEKGFTLVKIEMWLVVLPQIIARIHSNNRIVRELIQELLVRIGKGHPQVRNFLLRLINYDLDVQLEYLCCFLVKFTRFLHCYSDCHRITVVALITK